MAYHYDPQQALEEITEDHVLPNPVHVRDMILRAQLNPQEALELNRRFREYQALFADAQQLGRDLLSQLVHKRAA